MLATIFTKSLRDRWVAATTGTVLVGLFLIAGLAAYRELDLAIYTEMPAAIRAIAGIPDGADVASLAYGVMFGLMGAMTLGGIGISMGASTVAGEERAGTIGLLLANPRSRRAVLVSTLGATVVLVGAGALGFLAFGYLAPALLGVELGSSHVGAQVLHLAAHGLLFASLAAAIGAWTGNRALASAAPAGVLVLSYFLVGLLPLVESLAGAAKVLPWYWFDGHDPLRNGVAGGYLAVQLAATALLAGVAWIGVERRDLRRPTGGTGILTLVREHPAIARLLGRLSGGARVTGIWRRTLSENRAILLITAVAMFAMMGVMMGPLYATLEDTLASASAGLPEAVLAIAGGGDMTSPEGWYRLETFGLMAPIAVTLVAATVGARALAGEEQRRTMGLLLANPVSRSAVVLQKTVAMLLQAAFVGLATFAGVTAGSLLGGLGMSITGIAAASALATLLGTLFGAVALVVGAATGRVRVAVLATVGVASAAYVVNTILGLVDRLEGWARVSPFRWYLGGDPLVNGMDWGAATLLAAVTVALVAVAVALFDRRDLRRG